MKKTILLSVIISLSSLAVSAQIKKGSVLLGGQVSAYHSNTDWNTSQPDQ